MRFILNKDSLKDIPFKNKIYKNTISPGQWIEKWRNDRGYVLEFSKYKVKKSNTCILFIHGGGFDKNQPRDKDYQTLGYYLSYYTEFDTFLPDYTLAPDKKFPDQILEVISIANKLSDIYENIIIGGDSAGGTIAIQAAILQPKLFYSGFLLSPWIDLDGKYTPSYYSRSWNPELKTGDPIFKLDPKENIKSSKKEALNYLGVSKLFENPLANPVLATPGMLKDLPPFLFFIGDEEVIRDGILKIVGNAQTVNNNIFCYLYVGKWHDWLLYYQKNFKVKESYAFQILFNFCKSKVNNNELNFTYSPKKNENVIVANCNIVI